MSKRFLRLLILGEHVYSDGFNRLEEQSDGAYGVLTSGLDQGVFGVGLLDVVDLESDLVLLDDDEAVRAAVTLALLGWRPEQLGGLFNPKLSGGRPGRRLLEDGVEMLAARRRQRGLEFEAKRGEARQ